MVRLCVPRMYMWATQQGNKLGRQSRKSWMRRSSSDSCVCCGCDAAPPFVPIAAASCCDTRCDLKQCAAEGVVWDARLHLFFGRLMVNSGARPARQGLRSPVRVSRWGMRKESDARSTVTFDHVPLPQGQAGQHNWAGLALDGALLPQVYIRSAASFVSGAV
jgi:hypothetical protein